MPNTRRKSPIERTPFDPPMLRALRKQAGLTQYDATKELHISLARYHSYEHGACKKIPTRLLDRMRELAASPRAPERRRPLLARRIPLGADLAAELHESRLRAGLTQQTLADRLGLEVSLLGTYERGVPGTVPLTVVDRWREIVAREIGGKPARPAPPVVSVRYAGKSMADIAQDWATRLGFDTRTPVGVAHLASAMAIHLITIKRWLKQTKPIRRHPHTLVKYERTVAKLETELRAKFGLSHPLLATHAPSVRRPARRSKAKSFF